MQLLIIPQLHFCQFRTNRRGIGIDSDLSRRYDAIADLVSLLVIVPLTVRVKRLIHENEQAC